MSWESDQEWERQWHGDCANSYTEETKQYEYATRMGLDVFSYTENEKKGFNFGDKSIVDIGGGPYSLLLKSKAKRRVVVDPLDIPNWCKIRYEECGIEFIQEKAEDYLPSDHFDIGLIYNCLQHVIDPKKIIENMRQYVSIIYIHEWLDLPPMQGHPHTLTEKELNEWLGGAGRVEYNPQGAWPGKSYSGAFKA